MSRRRRQHEEADETVELGEVLEPYCDMDEWSQDAYPSTDEREEMVYAQLPVEGYLEEELEETDEIDHESRFRIALGMFDIISILVGIAAVLMLVAMLLTLYNWLRSDIVNSALFLQIGMQ